MVTDTVQRIVFFEIGILRSIDDFIIDEDIEISIDGVAAR